MDGSRASHKRPRIDDDPSGSPPLSSSSSLYLARICLTRDEVTKYSKCAFFDKLARGHYIRATVSGSDGKPTPRLLLIRSISSSSSSSSITTYTLLVNDPEKGVDVQLPITSISNSQPNEIETDNLVKSLHRARDQNAKSATSTQVQLPTPAEIDKMVALRLRIIQDAADGRACAAPASLKAASTLIIWGGDSAGQSATSQHEALVVFRSWLLQDVLIEQATTKREMLNATPDVHLKQDGVAPFLGDSTWAEGGPLLLQPCIAEGRGIDSITGAAGGPRGHEQRAGGQFSYLFLHKVRLNDAKPDASEGLLESTATSSSSSSSTTTTNLEGYLEAFCTPPAVYDEHQPDITAWRAARKFIDNSITLELFRASIIAQVDQSPELSQTSRGTSSGTGTVTSSAGFGVRCLNSPVQLFLVDIDSIARQLGQQQSQTFSSTTNVVSNLRSCESAPVEQLSPLDDGSNFQAKQWLLRTVVGHKNNEVSNVQIQEMLLRTQKEELAAAADRRQLNNLPRYFLPEGRVKGTSSLESTNVVSIQRFNNGIAVLSEIQLEAAMGRKLDTEKPYIQGQWDDVSQLLIGNDEQSITRTLFAICYGSTDERNLQADQGAPRAPAPGLSPEDPGVLSDAVYACLRQQRPQKHKHKDLSQSSYAPSWPFFSPHVVSHLALSSATSSSAVSSLESMKPLLPHGPNWVPQLFPRRFNHEHSVILYHGTSLSMAKSIQENGFFRARCRMAEACLEDSCSCNMLGFGVYFGDKSKALHFATRRAVFDTKTGKHVAAIVRVKVDLGLVKVASGPCPCGRKGGCSAPFVDHWGDYYSQQGFDSLYIRAGSSGAANQREWAVSDPKRCVVLGVEELNLSDETLH